MRKDLADMVVMISQTTDKYDLQILNERIATQFKYLQQLEAKKAKIKLRIGQKVSFWSKISGATPHVGKIKKINRTKAIVAIPGSFDWNVPLAKLTIEGIA